MSATWDVTALLAAFLASRGETALLQQRVGDSESFDVIVTWLADQQLLQICNAISSWAAARLSLSSSCRCRARLRLASPASSSTSLARASLGSVWDGAGHRGVPLMLKTSSTLNRSYRFSGGTRNTVRHLTASPFCFTTTYSPARGLVYLPPRVIAQLAKLPQIQLSRDRRLICARIGAGATETSSCSLTGPRRSG